MQHKPHNQLTIKVQQQPCILFLTNHTACAPHIYQDEMNDSSFYGVPNFHVGLYAFEQLELTAVTLGSLTSKRFLTFTRIKAELHMLCGGTVPLVYFEESVIWCCGWEGCEM